jgi:hypothetical protein
MEVRASNVLLLAMVVGGLGRHQLIRRLVEVRRGVVGAATTRDD